ncbi:MAG: PHP domain-containing protein [Actinomycetia bacterium]|nr:PHP domain-containing protein [Actinomycetes bacterium]MCP4960956.1 PHP domain-containing protein [Actinomycetes bacterium]
MVVEPPRSSEEAIERHPHLAHARMADKLRVDMHTHTMWSGDSTTTPDEVREAIEGAALDVLCVTDHHTIEGALRLENVLPCRVVVGEEVRTHTGELIGLFLDERIPQGLAAAETAKRIRDQGAIVYVPHPFDPMRCNIEESSLYELAEAGLIDAVEVLNAKTSLESLNARARRFADEFDLAAGAGSDAHVAEALGSAYVEMDLFDDARSFLAALRSSAVIGHHSDPPRRWRPRIIPSIDPLS